MFTFVLLTVLRVPNALALAAFAGFTDVIPFVGGILATAPAALASLSRGPGVTIAILVLMVAYQEFESRFLIPRIYGRTLKLPSAGVLVALLIGGRLGGVFGALFALPIAAAIVSIVKELRVELPATPRWIPRSGRRTPGPSGPTRGGPRERTPPRPRRPRSRWPSGARLAESVAEPERRAAIGLQPVVRRLAVRCAAYPSERTRTVHCTGSGRCEYVAANDDLPHLRAHGRAGTALALLYVFLVSQAFVPSRRALPDGPAAVGAHRALRHRLGADGGGRHRAPSPVAAHARRLAPIAGYGLLANACYLGTPTRRCASLSSGMGAIIASTNPLLLALVAPALLDEPLTARKVRAPARLRWHLLIAMSARAGTQAARPGDVLLAFLGVVALVGSTLVFKRLGTSEGFSSRRTPCSSAPRPWCCSR